MTKHKLKQYVYLGSEIARCKKELDRLQLRFNNSVSGTERANIRKQAVALGMKIKECENLKSEIEDFINSIPDILTRQIFYYRYLKCMTWFNVAIAVGGGNTHEGVRKIAERYLASKGGER